MITGILIVYLIVVLLMVGTILIQKNEGGGLVSSNTGGLVSSRGAKNFLTRLTAILATLFFALSILLAILFKSDSAGRRSIIDSPVSQNNAGNTSVEDSSTISKNESEDIKNKNLSVPIEPTAPVAE